MNKILLASSIFALLAAPVFADFDSFRQDVISGTTNLDVVVIETGNSVNSLGVKSVDVTNANNTLNGTPSVEVIDLTDRDENGVRMATVILDSVSETLKVSYQKSVVGNLEIIHDPSVDVSTLDIDSLPRWHDDEATQVHFDHNKGKSNFEIIPFVTLGDENGN